MGDRKEVVLLTGASGSMGFATFKLLWEKRDRYNIVLFLRPLKSIKKRFRKYEGRGGTFGRSRMDSSYGVKIVWGDVLIREDVVEACRGIDWCLHPMALISPAADRDPEMADLVNARGTQYLVEAIEVENPEHIRLVYVGTVAKYGDRLPPVHVGRTGDPLIPSAFDHYAISKVKGELAVMQSKIKRKVSLRQTFIMIPKLFSLMDPIMFHQPLNSFMESITVRDAGRMMVKCLEMGDDSDFWGGYYNVSGGPSCRITYIEFLDRIYSMLGIRYRRVMERQWFALKNFHMLFYEDSGRLNEYLHHWERGQTLEDLFGEVWKHMPIFLKATAWYAKHIPPYRGFVEAVTHGQLEKLANKDDGTLAWIRNKDTGKINAFYGSMEEYLKIPEWDRNMPSLDHDQSFTRLEHGYDESKEKLTREDLHMAAAYRGGQLKTLNWNGELHASLQWKCCQGHAFSMTPHAVLKGGHWCIECISPPWNYKLIAGQNPFAAQVLELPRR